MITAAATISTTIAEQAYALLWRAGFLTITGPEQGRATAVLT